MPLRTVFGPIREKRGISQKRTSLLRDSLQPSTNSEKLSGALLAARVASASVTSASALHAWTSRLGLAHPRMAGLHNLLHASHFTCVEPDLDAARVEGGFREDVSHNAASKLPRTLVLLLCHVYLQSWLDVFAITTVHVGGLLNVVSGFTQAYRGTRVAMCSGVTVMSTRGSVFQRAT